MQQQHFTPTVGLLSSDEFLNSTFPRIAAMFPMILGHVDALPEKGDYYVPPHASDEIYLFRGDDGAIRAFRNVCTHRNARFAPADTVINDELFPRQGKAVDEDLIRCPWHAKTFTGRGIARNAGPPLVPTEYCGTLRVYLMTWVRERCGPSCAIGRTRDAGQI